MPTHVFFTLLKSKSSQASPGVLEKTFKEHFSASSEQPFDKTLFHFLLGRLAAVGSRVAVVYCLQILEERPEETDPILRYFAQVGLNLPELHSLISTAESPEIILDYQLFQLLRWFLEHSIESARVLQLARKWAYDHNRSPWLRSHSLAYLGRYGDTADLDTLEQRYSLLSAELEKADYASALERLEIGRRNAFYAKAKADGDWVRRAIAVVKAS